MMRDAKISRLLILVAVVSCLAWTGMLLHAQQGTIKMKVNPGRAGVFVDGKYVGPARDFGLIRYYPISPGSHEIVLREPRYKESSKTVEVQSHKTTTVDVGMERLPEPKPPFGRLRVQAKERFDPVFINGGYMGHVDEFDNVFERLLLPPGEYELVVRSMAGQEFKQKIKIEADKTTHVKVSF